MNAVQRNATIVVVHVKRNAAIDATDVHVAMVGCDGYGCCHLAHVYVAMIRLHGQRSRMRNGDSEVCLSTVNRVDVEL